MDRNFELGWAVAALKGLSHCSADIRRGCLTHCAVFHYESGGVASAVSRFRGNLQGFLAFTESEYGWKNLWDQKAHLLLIDENKSSCACPLARFEEDLPECLCECSVLFFCRIFSDLLCREVSARVVRSCLRGDPSCVYEISLPG